LYQNYLMAIQYTKKTEPDKAAPAPLPKPKGKGGRPRLEDIDKTLEATKPWEKAGMSRASWYRRPRKAD
jgi:hypothetical protein